MKATGIVRRVDDLGRIVIPKEIRRTLLIREGDPLHTTLYNIEILRLVFFEALSILCSASQENNLYMKQSSRPSGRLLLIVLWCSGFTASKRFSSTLNCFVPIFPLYSSSVSFTVPLWPTRNGKLP